MNCILLGMYNLMYELVLELQIQYFYNHKFYPYSNIPSKFLLFYINGDYKFTNIHFLITSIQFNQSIDSSFAIQYSTIKNYFPMTTIYCHGWRR
jgi:hypothetical protein